MQWAPRRGVGFTSGTAWESPQPDSLTVTVVAQNADPGSLLNRYRKLIHLRKQNEALATGRLVPLAATSPQVASYLRCAGSHAVLVVANLGGASAAGVSISSRDSVLTPGSYTARNVLGGPNGASLEVSADGGIRGYVPLRRSIGSRESLVLDLTHR
jgi:glycosidase